MTIQRARASTERITEVKATEAESTYPSASTAEPSARPMTGEEYIAGLRDGREIYLYGERIKDVTTHPAFRNSVRDMREVINDYSLQDKNRFRTANGLRPQTFRKANSIDPGSLDKIVIDIR